MPSGRRCMPSGHWSSKTLFTQSGAGVPNGMEKNWFLKMLKVKSPKDCGLELGMMEVAEKKKMNEIKTGWAIHCHHNRLVEFCYDYNERVEYIKNYKPKNEVELRLKLFRLLPIDALNDIPAAWQEAYAKWQEVYAKWQEAYAKWQEVYAKWQEVYAKWPLELKNAFHAKWCGCSEWNGKELVFENVKS